MRGLSRGSAEARRRVPVHPSITKYSDLRDSLLRKGEIDKEVYVLRRLQEAEPHWIFRR